MKIHSRLWIVAALVLLATSSLRAEDKQEEKLHVMKLAEGKLELKASGKWEKVAPRVRIIEYEFSVPAAEGDEKPGRVTVMGAGGSIEANIKRWIGQFSQPDGASTEDKTKVEEKVISGQGVHVVDVSGTYLDRPGGPFAGGKLIERPNYRMLAAILMTKKDGNYFVKFYGPAKTVSANEKEFHALVESLQLN